MSASRSSLDGTLRAQSAVALTKNAIKKLEISVLMLTVLIRGLTDHLVSAQIIGRFIGCGLEECRGK